MFVWNRQALYHALLPLDRSRESRLWKSRGILGLLALIPLGIVAWHLSGPHNSKPIPGLRTQGYVGPPPVTCPLTLDDATQRLDDELKSRENGDKEWSRAIYQSTKTAHITAAMNTWQRLGWRYQVLSDADASAWINATLPSDLVETYHSLPLPVMRADMLRYALLWAQGGVWSDADTILLSDIDDWAPSLDHSNLLVGVEMDHHMNLDVQWQRWGWAAQDRGYDFVQWTLRARRYSPALRRTLTKLWQRARATSAHTDADVLRITGPVVMTDAVLEEMACERGNAVSWLDISALDKPAAYQGVMILPVAAFNGDDNDSMSSRLVRHLFASSWKQSEGWW